MMHETLVKLDNLLNELGASDLLSQVRLTAMVTHMVENIFSLMRKDDPMPKQLEYGTRRATCVRELWKRMCRGLFYYYTGPKSDYPDKVINGSPNGAVDVRRQTATARVFFDIWHECKAAHYIKRSEQRINRLFALCSIFGSTAKRAWIHSATHLFPW